MDSSSSSLQSTIQTLVKNIKEDTLSKLDHNHHDLISPSAYDTAWLAMVPHPHDSSRPLFEECLNWVLNNQNELGCWGEYSSSSGSTVDSLPSTLACLIALNKWNVGDQLIHKGLRCMNANIKMLQKSNCQHLPKWFAIVFPAMVELAKLTTTLDLPQDLETIVSSILVNREEIVDYYKCEYAPLLSYLEAVLPKYEVDEKISLKQEIIDQEEDGSLMFQSPSATAQAFMLTGNPKYMDYLRSLVLKFPNGVPPMYPTDEEMIKLCIIDHIQRLGLAEYFHKEIGDILIKVYRNYNDQEPNCNEIDFVPAKIYKDSLAFRLLRMHDYDVTSRRFCWFVHDKELMVKMEHNYEHFSSLMYNVYRATDVLFPEEYEWEKARSLSKNFLQNALLRRNNIADDNIFMSPISNKMIEHELSVPWIARLDHLDHRFWIEENKFTPLCIGIGLNDSFHRLQCCHNTKLMRLAVKNYEFRQSIYGNELEELTRWSKEWGLSEMGFGREKTTYCYFAVAASACQLPLGSAVRQFISKSAIIVTVADDFYDMQNGSLHQLHALTRAIQRWDGEGLSGHSKTIFMALDNLVTEMAENWVHQDANNITQIIQDIWRDTFESWMIETSRSINGYLPSIDEYLETGMTSIAAHTILLPPSFLLNFNRNPLHLDAITKLLMVMTRILNDTQSYEKEEKEGKMNLVSLIKETNGVNLQASAAVIKDIVLDGLRKEFLKRVFTDDLDDLPKDFKLLHLSCLKVFQMFFNAKNSFDSDTDLIQDINKAFYLPLENHISKPLKMPSVLLGREKKNRNTLSITSCFDQVAFKCRATRNFSGEILLKKVSGNISGKKVFMVPKISVCFI